MSRDDIMQNLKVIFETAREINEIKPSADSNSTQEEVEFEELVPVIFNYAETFLV